MNESDTSGGLSAFKSYRMLRALMEMMDSQVLLLTGSGMGFQNQHYLAAAVWKGLRESLAPLPALLRFGGTDEDKARALIEKVAPDLPVPVKVFPPHVFSHAMVDHIPDLATRLQMRVTPEPQPVGEPTFSVTIPPGEFYFFPEKWTSPEAPPCINVCPSGFLYWNRERRTIEPVNGAHCIGCLLCETISLTESNGELRIKLSMPKVD
jgi:NAD-dependent dihydropyrimidine dehydrogenase PreA subunit